MLGNTSDRAGTETGPDAASAAGPLLTPAQLAARYGLGLTRVYEQCRQDGALRDVAVHWGRRILIPARAAARIFGEEVDQ
jgi:hypothetical protein